MTKIVRGRLRDRQLMDRTHMMPMEDPAGVARLIDDAMAAP